MVEGAIEVKEKRGNDLGFADYFVSLCNYRGNGTIDRLFLRNQQFRNFLSSRNFQWLRGFGPLGCGCI
jgi:hypothetical protein